MKKYIIALSLAALSLSLAACDHTPDPTQTTPPPTTTAVPTEPTVPIRTGWHRIGNHICYFNEFGIRHTGWLELSEGRYYFDGAGVMQTGWLELPDGRYYFDEAGVMQTGWLEDATGRYFLSDSGIPYTGWQEVDGLNRYFLGNGALASGFVDMDGTAYYFTADGTLTSGWLKLDDNTYYLNEDGSVHTGWYTEGADRYYFRENGAMARGMVMVSETEARYFTSTGKEIILVNPWNFVPEDYEVELVKYNSRYQVAAQIYEPLKQMLADCKTAGYTAIVGSAYRTHEYQEGLFENKIQRVMKAEGCTREEAMVIAATVVAFPGTSEHQLGLAVDLVDIKYQLLDENQENTEAQKWLMEHCWEYGFILRYPNDKSEYTGIIYEPWHYRYVGTELAAELHELGISLEEYLDLLTEA